MTPDVVARALARAQRAGFSMVCEPAVGRLLAALAAAVPQQGRILELGTGVGVGTAWIVHGLGARTDVELVTVELDVNTAAVAAEDGWPPFVSLRVGEALDLLPALGAFDLIFADTPGGKIKGLDRTIAALNAGGVLVVDDMTPQPGWEPEWPELIERVRQRLLTHPQLVAVELEAASGVIAAARRR